MTAGATKGLGFVEGRVYFHHIFALLVPGSSPRQHAVVSKDVATPGKLIGWTDDELKLLIEECRFTLTDQSKRFDQVRTTSQILLPLAFGLAAIFGGELRGVLDTRGWWKLALLAVSWIIGCLACVLAGLGAAAVLSVRAEFGRIMPTLLSKERRPILAALANGYVRQVAVGETTVSTRLTIIRDAVALLTVGVLLQLLVWTSLQTWA